MNQRIKGGLIGFIITFIGLWIILSVVGHDSGGLKCVVSIDKISYCSFFSFITNIFHVGFALLFSWIGFFAGIINVRRIQKIIDENRGHQSIIPLKVTSTIMLTAVIVFGLIGVIAFDNWVNTMIYAIVFSIFVVFVTWAVARWKYKRH
ncbi:MAG: hypothetical protein AABW51_00160 [Nanoarchaeota archaeon]